MATLAEMLARETREGELYEVLPDGRLRCFACGHCCPLPDGAVGVCKVRFNERGRLLVPTNYVAALACDPTEKKPFFHLLPGSDTLTFGMLGCDLHCAYCQNWITSQSLRDDAAGAATLVQAVTSFGEDEQGELYVVTDSTFGGSGSVSRIVGPCPGPPKL